MKGNNSLEVNQFPCVRLPASLLFFLFALVRNQTQINYLLRNYANHCTTNTA